MESAVRHNGLGLGRASKDWIFMETSCSFQWWYGSQSRTHDGTGKQTFIFIRGVRRVGLGFSALSCACIHTFLGSSILEGRIVGLSFESWLNEHL